MHHQPPSVLACLTHTGDASPHLPHVVMYCRTKYEAYVTPGTGVTSPVYWQGEVGVRLLYHVGRLTLAMGLSVSPWCVM